MHQQAISARDAELFEMAETIWREASAMMSTAGDHAWYTTRVALPLKAIAHMYRDVDPERSIAAYQEYFAINHDSMGVRESIPYCQLLLDAQMTEEAIQHLTIRIEYLPTQRWASEAYKQQTIDNLIAARDAIASRQPIPELTR